MILTDQEILAEIMTERVNVTPFSKELINPSSLDVRLGKNFGVVKAQYVNIDPTDPHSFYTDTQEYSRYILGPKKFVVSCLMEHITLPRNISVKLMGKSSLGRLGIENSSCAGWVDPGFSGVLTIELFNYSDEPIILTPGMKIGQLTFFKHKDCLVSYGEKETSKYQNQTPGQGSKGVDKLP